MQDLKVTIVQTDISWKNPKNNRDKIETWLAGSKDTDVILLPEMFTTGFTMELDKVQETMDGVTIAWMKELAKQKNASVCGSVIVMDEGKSYNRAIWVFPDGQIEHYDKRHLYTMGKEHLYYEQGRSKTIINFRGWRFCPLICYDLRFPVWSRNLENYDVLIYMANWPSPRHHVWKNLLVARAIENQSYCIGVNRVGSDGQNLNYLGDSGFVTPKGVVEYLGPKEQLITRKLSYEKLIDFRSSFPLLNDMDRFDIQL